MNGSSGRCPCRPPRRRRPLFPADGGRRTGPTSSSSGSPRRSPPGSGIADYHFELSDRADMAWPLSSNFEKLVSNTADHGKPRYSLPYAGLLTPGRVLLARPGQERQRRLGPVEQDVELHAGRTGAAGGRDAWNP